VGKENTRLGSRVKVNEFPTRKWGALVPRYLRDHLIAVSMDENSKQLLFVIMLYIVVSSYSHGILTNCQNVVISVACNATAAVLAT
jgi:hypothetical protein